MLRWTALAAACLLGACQTLVPKAPVRAPERQPVVRAEPQTEPTVEAGIPRDTERNRVALLVPLSGSNSGVGRSIANATMLALLDTKSERVRITNYDTATGAAAAAKKAIEDGARLILGPLLAEDVRAVSPVARAAGVPVMSFSNDTNVAGDGTYLLGYIPGQSIERAVGYANSRGVKTFAGLVPNGLYGQRTSTAFLRAVEAAGGQVLSLQPYGRSDGGMAAAAKRLAGSGPFGAILIADGAAAAAVAAPIVKAGTGGATQIIGTELWNSDNTVAARKALNGAIFASVSDSLYRQYAIKYRTRYGTSPYRLSSLGYDSVLLTVRIARNWTPGTAFPSDKLNDSDGFAGIDGAFRFNRDGVAERALEVQQLTNGNSVIVSPAPQRFGN